MFASRLRLRSKEVVAHKAFARWNWHYFTFLVVNWVKDFKNMWERGLKNIRFLVFLFTVHNYFLTKVYMQFFSYWWSGMPLNTQVAGFSDIACHSFIASGFRIVKTFINRQPHYWHPFLMLHLPHFIFYKYWCDSALLVWQYLLASWCISSVT